MWTIYRVSHKCTDTFSMRECRFEEKDGRIQYNCKNDFVKS